MQRNLLVLILSICIPVIAQAQQAITGTVVSATDGETLIGASVIVKDSSTGGVP